MVFDDFKTGKSDLSMKLQRSLMVLFLGLFFGCRPAWATQTNHNGYIIDDTTHLIVYFDGNYATDLIIPSDFDGIKVNGIGDGAFSGKQITSVTLGSGITTIGKSAFAGCTALKSVILPAGMTSIGVAAFNNCTALTKISLPSDLVSIGDQAFQFCSALVSYNHSVRLDHDC
jgi:hypothetical protein